MEALHAAASNSGIAKKSSCHVIKDRQRALHGDNVTSPSRLITIVDDDQSIRESLPDLLEDLGYSSRAFSSAEEFLVSGCMEEADCLFLDIVLAGMSGLDLQSELAKKGCDIPIVFITASHDAATRDLVLSRGAVDCLFKPFSESALLAALDAVFS